MVSVANLRSPFLATRSPGSSQWFSTLDELGTSPLLPGLSEPERLSRGGHARNAKLVFEVTLRSEALSSGIYSRPELRLRRRHLPPVASAVSSNDDRTV